MSTKALGFAGLVQGLWFGLLCGALCQDTALATVLFRTDWMVEVNPTLCCLLALCHVPGGGQDRNQG